MQRPDLMAMQIFLLFVCRISIAALSRYWPKYQARPASLAPPSARASQSELANSNLNIRFRLLNER